MNPQKLPAFAILRIETEAISDHHVTVTKLVATVEEAIGEVDRLNGLRRDPSYRYVWQTTRYVPAAAEAGGDDSPVAVDLSLVRAIYGAECDPVEEIESRDDLVRFLFELSEAVRGGSVIAENDRLHVYLEAASGWVGDMDGAYKHRGDAWPQDPSWSMIARIFRAALSYE